MLALSSAACGGEQRRDAAASSRRRGGLAKVDLTCPGDRPGRPLRAGREEGHLREARHRPEISFVEPAALVPTLMSGDADFIWGNPPALMAARANNVPIKSVTTVSVAGDDPDHLPDPGHGPHGQRHQVARGPGRQEGGDGVAVPAATTSRSWSRWTKAGVDASSVKFVEIPFPNMAEALSGRARRRDHLHRALRDHH